MKKQIHFLSGLPRSGNTLLSSILNQNPDIYSSPLSELTTLMFNTYESLVSSNNTLRNKEVAQCTERVLREIPSIYYDNISQPIIFDREKAWGTPYNLNLIKSYITPNPKIIFTVRSFLDIIKSYLALDIHLLKTDYLISNHFSLNYRPFDDGYVDYIMRPGGEIDKIVLSLAGAMLEENKGIFHLVEYDDLISNPEKVMDGIYQFLNLPSFKHNFDWITKKEEDDDVAIGYPKEMHSIKNKIEKIEHNIVLSDYVKQKYSNLEFWRKESKIKVKSHL